MSNLRFKTLNQRFVAAEEQACKMALREADVEGDEGMRGLKPGMEGYLECKNTVLCARISAISKRSFWLQAQVEQVCVCVCACVCGYVCVCVCVCVS